MVGALTLGGCATTEAVSRAQETADHAVSLAQSGQTAAQRAQEAADRAATQAQLAQTSAQKAQASADATASTAQAAEAAARNVSDQVAQMKPTVQHVAHHHRHGTWRHVRHHRHAKQE
jgi:hypothetical protein